MEPREVNGKELIKIVGGFLPKYFHSNMIKILKFKDTQNKIVYELEGNPLDVYNRVVDLVLKYPERRYIILYKGDDLDFVYGMIRQIANEKCEGAPDPNMLGKLLKGINLCCKFERELIGNSETFLKEVNNISIGFSKLFTEVGKLISS